MVTVERQLSESRPIYILITKYAVFYNYFHQCFLYLNYILKGATLGNEKTIVVTWNILQGWQKGCSNRTRGKNATPCHPIAIGLF